jgi:hypothetical protein
LTSANKKFESRTACGLRIRAANLITEKRLHREPTCTEEDFTAYPSSSIGVREDRKEWLGFARRRCCPAVLPNPMVDILQFYPYNTNTCSVLEVEQKVLIED